MASSRPSSSAPFVGRSAANVASEIAGSLASDPGFRGHSLRTELSFSPRWFPPPIRELRLQPSRNRGPRSGNHVTIGRVEVRAVPQPAPVPQAKRSAAPAMSLDNYLKQRKTPDEQFRNCHGDGDVSQVRAKLCTRMCLAPRHNASLMPRCPSPPQTCSSTKSFPMALATRICLRAVPMGTGSTPPGRAQSPLPAHLLRDDSTGAPTHAWERRGHFMPGHCDTAKIQQTIGQAPFNAFWLRRTSRKGSNW